MPFLSATLATFRPRSIPQIGIINWLHAIPRNHIGEKLWTMESNGCHVYLKKCHSPVAFQIHRNSWEMTWNRHTWTSWTPPHESGNNIWKNAPWMGGQHPHAARHASGWFLENTWHPWPGKRPPKEKLVPSDEWIGFVCFFFQKIRKSCYFPHQTRGFQRIFPSNKSGFFHKIQRPEFRISTETTELGMHIKSGSFVIISSGTNSAFPLLRYSPNNQNVLSSLIDFVRFHLAQRHSM